MPPPSPRAGQPAHPACPRPPGTCSKARSASWANCCRFFMADVVLITRTRAGEQSRGSSPSRVFSSLSSSRAWYGLWSRVPGQRDARCALQPTGAHFRQKGPRRQEERGLRSEPLKTCKGAPAVAQHVGWHLWSTGTQVRPAQWVEDLMLLQLCHRPQLWLGSDPWPWSPTCHGAAEKEMSILPKVIYRSSTFSLKFLRLLII